MGGFAVDLTTLDAHAAGVAALAERLQRASELGAPLSLDAYGLVGRAFAAVAVDAVRTGSQAVVRLGVSADDIVDGLRADAAAYRAAERTACAVIRAVR
jgi:hypothetical protein